MTSTFDAQSIEKLNGNNFHTWKMKMEFLLHEKVLSVITLRELLPPKVEFEYIVLEGSILEHCLYMKRNKFKGFSQIITTIKTKLLVTILSISTIFKDAWFINYRASQHLTFQKEVFSTFEEFIWSHKVYFEDNSLLDVCGKGTLSSTCQMGFPNVLELYVSKLAKTLLSVNQLIEQDFKVEFETTKC